MIDWSEEAKKVLVIDWNKPVQTDGGSEVVRLDDNFNSRHGMATLFKVLKASDFVSDGSDWVGYRVHSNSRCYSVYIDQELHFGIKNIPTKHQGWIAIYADPPLFRYTSNIYRTEKECRVATAHVLPVPQYMMVEWEEP